MLLRGDGVSQDSAEALEWFRKAADRDFAGAQGWLGIVYFHGLGVRQNYVQAHMWFNLAAAHPLDLSNKKDRERAIDNLQFVTSKMTPEQIAEAQKLASEWKPKQ
jgi:TPR repeat protein